MTTAEVMLKLKVEKLSLKDGDLLVLKMPYAVTQTVDGVESVHQTCSGVLDAMGLAGKVTVLLLPEGYDAGAFEAEGKTAAVVHAALAGGRAKAIADCLRIAEKWYEGHPGSEDIADEIRALK